MPISTGNPATDMLLNNTLNRVYPQRQPPILPAKDARTYGLDVLKRYIGALIFRRVNAPGEPPIPFQIPLANIHTKQPDDPKDMGMPGISFVPARGIHDSYGLGPPTILEETEGIAGPQTALLRCGEYTEQLVIEVWGSKHAERVGIVAGLKSALRDTDGSYGIYLGMPDYWNETVGFELDESQYIDGDEVSRNRRRAFLMVTMRINEVILTHVTKLATELETSVADVTLQLATEEQRTKRF